MSVGIIAHGAYVPPTRLPLSLITGRPAKDGGPEKAVAWNDEDAVTMAVAAAGHCLQGCDRQRGLVAGRNVLDGVANDDAGGRIAGAAKTDGVPTAFGQRRLWRGSLCHHWVGAGAGLVFPDRANDLSV